MGEDWPFSAGAGSAGEARVEGERHLDPRGDLQRALTRKGIATEISSALTTAAFTVPYIDRVEIHHDKANVASAGVPRRLGYTFVDETQDSVTSPGEVGIDCRWMITKHEWIATTNNSGR